MSRPLVPLNVLLVAVSLASVGDIARELAPRAPGATVRVRAVPLPSTLLGIAQPEDPPPAESYATVATSRNLFSPTRTEAPQSPAAASLVPAGPTPHLYGVVLREGASIAYLEDPHFPSASPGTGPATRWREELCSSSLPTTSSSIGPTAACKFSSAIPRSRARLRPLPSHPDGRRRFRARGSRGPVPQPVAPAGPAPGQAVTPAQPPTAAQPVPQLPRHGPIPPDLLGSSPAPQQ